MSGRGGLRCCVHQQVRSVFFYLVLIISKLAKTQSKRTPACSKVLVYSPDVLLLVLFGFSFPISPLFLPPLSLFFSLCMCVRVNVAWLHNYKDQLYDLFCGQIEALDLQNEQYRIKFERQGEDCSMKISIVFFFFQFSFLIFFFEHSFFWR